jgi:hypothetical protein
MLLPHQVILPRFLRVSMAFLIVLDIFVDRKPKSFFEPPICSCEIPTDGSPGCGESCLNRYG